MSRETSSVPYDDEQPSHASCSGTEPYEDSARPPSNDENATSNENAFRYDTPSVSGPSETDSDSDFDALFEGEPDPWLYGNMEEEPPQMVATRDVSDDARGDRAVGASNQVFEHNHPVTVAMASGGLGYGDGPFTTRSEGFGMVSERFEHSGTSTNVFARGGLGDGDAPFAANFSHRLAKITDGSPVEWVTRLIELRGDVNRKPEDDDMYSSTGSSCSISELPDEHRSPSNFEHGGTVSDYETGSPMEDQKRGTQQRSASFVQPNHFQARRVAPESTSASLLHSMPYLSEITPAESQSHHPSTILLSPRRGSSSLSSSVNDIQHTPMHREEEFLTSTERDLHSTCMTVPTTPTEFEKASVQTGTSDTPTNDLSSPFRRPQLLTYSSSTRRSSPLRKLNSTDTAGIDAANGPSTACQPVDSSRPDTPRPSIDYTSSQLSIHNSMPQSHSWTRNNADRPTTDNFSMAKESCAAPRSPRDFPSSVQLNVKTLDTTPMQLPNYSGLTQLEKFPRITSGSPGGTNPSQNLSSCESSPASSISLKAWGQPGQDIRIATTAPPLSGPEFTSSFLYGQIREEKARSDQRSAIQDDRKLLRAQKAEQMLQAMIGHSEDARSNNFPEQLQPSYDIAVPNLDLQQVNSSQQGILDPGKRPSDPFAGNRDMILFPEPSADDSPPLSPLIGLQGAIYQAKRGARKATASQRKPTRNVTGKARVVSASPKKLKKGTAVVSKVATNVQGEGVKISKTRGQKGPRSVSRKVTAVKGKSDIAGSTNIPPVPNLPEDMDIDSPPSRLQATPQQSTPTPSKEQTAIDRIITSSSPGRKHRRRPKKHGQSSPNSTIASPNLKVAKTRDHRRQRHPTIPKCAPTSIDVTTPNHSNAPKTPDHTSAPMDLDSPIQKTASQQATSQAHPTNSSHAVPSSSPLSSSTTISSPSPSPSPSPTPREQIPMKRRATSISKRRPEHTLMTSGANGDQGAAAALTGQSGRLTPQKTVAVRLGEDRHTNTPVRRSPRLKGVTPSPGL